MKRFWLIAVLAVFLVGCAGIQLSGKDQLQSVAIKDAAMIAGYKLAQERPDVVRAARPYAAAMLEAANGGKPVTGLWSQGLELLTEQIGGDPLLAALVSDAAALVVIDDQAMVSAAIQEKIKAALAGFVAGMDLAQR